MGRRLGKRALESGQILGRYGLTTRTIDLLRLALSALPLLMAIEATGQEPNLAGPRTGDIAPSAANTIVKPTRDRSAWPSSSLRLPDGSVIKTVWPAALSVVEVSNRPWPNEPVTPRCEPAVYSLARVMPDGSELWAMSYVHNSAPLIDVCYAEYFGFTVRSRLGEVDSPGFYRLPYDGHFYIGDPDSGEGRLRIDAATGHVVGKRPIDLRVIEAHELRELKLRIDKEISRELPHPASKKGQMNGEVAMRQLYRRVEEALFAPANAPSRNPDSRK